MKEKITLLLVLSILVVSLSFAEVTNPERPWDFSFELNMMLHAQFDVEYFFNESMGLKGGFSIPGISGTSFTYNVLFVYHFNLPSEHFQLDIEAGLPLAYFDFIEGRYVDWDPYVDDPYYGFIPGLGLLASYRFNQKQALGLRIGAGMLLEHQLQSGWRKPWVAPVIALVYNI